MRQTQGFYEGEEVRLERGGELAEAVLVSDPAFLTASTRRRRDRGLPRSRGRRRRVRLTVLAGVAVHRITAALYSGAFHCWPRSPRRVCRWPGRRASGARVVDELAPADHAVRDPSGPRALDEIVARLDRGGAAVALHVSRHGERP